MRDENPPYKATKKDFGAGDSTRRGERKRTKGNDHSERKRT
jgi:hypothetical protein